MSTSIFNDLTNKLDFKKSQLFWIFFQNTLLLLCALYFSWNTVEFLLCFWIETLLIGFVNIFKILIAEGRIKKNRKEGYTKVGKRILYAFLFLLHFGIFTLVQGSVIYAIVQKSFDLINFIKTGYPAFLILLTRHIFVFIKDFIGEGYYQISDPKSLMFKPYGRVILQHLLILSCVFLIAITGKNNIIAAACFIFAIHLGADIIYFVYRRFISPRFNS